MITFIGTDIVEKEFLKQGGIECNESEIRRLKNKQTNKQKQSKTKKNTHKKKKKKKKKTFESCLEKLK